MDAHRELQRNDQMPHNALTPAVKQFFDQFAEQENDHKETLAIQSGLDHLNVDFLLEVFSQNCMISMDLCAFAETCKPFKQTVQLVFPKKMDLILDYVLYCDTTLKNYDGMMESVHNVEKVFKHFGPCLVGLSVHGCGASDLMNLVAKHCVGTLIDLEICWIEINEALAVALKPIFRQLQKLTIKDTLFPAGAIELVNCDSLIELSVIEERLSDAIMVKNFPKLQRFIINAEYGLDSDYLLNFLERHKNLKSLKMSTPSFETMDFWQKFGNICQELEDLDMESLDNRGKTLDFSHFLNLKRLRLDCGHCEENVSIVQLQTLTSLEVLHIGGAFESNEFSEALPFLKNLLELHVRLDSVTEPVQWTSLPQLLTKLSFASNIHVIDNIVDIIRQLSNLEELEMYVNSFVLSEKVFYEIVTVVKERPTVLTLTCRFDFSQFSESGLKICDENFNVKIANWKQSN